jgi:hypothetical protein
MLAVGLMCGICLGQAAPGLLVEIRSGYEGKKLGFQELGLGSGGLLERKKWKPTPRRVDADEIVTRGGARILFGRSPVQVILPDGKSLGIDDEGRFVGQNGSLSLVPMGDLNLRLGDGSEIRMRPGDAKNGPRELTLIDQGKQYLLKRRRALMKGSRREVKSRGLRFYLCGDGNVIASLSDFGTFLYVQPIVMRGTGVEPRLIVLGDLLKHGAERIYATSPRRSAQFPLARKQARAVADWLREEMPDKKPKVRRMRIPKGLEIILGLGDGRLRVERHGLAKTQSIHLGLHLNPDAEATLEYQTFARGSFVQRVQAKRFQTRSRYQGKAIPLFRNQVSDVYLWPGPLSSTTQHRMALKALAPWLIQKAKAEPMNAGARR